MTVKKAYTYIDFKKRNFKTIKLEGEWKRHLGTIERSGSILVMGGSGHGKTTYVMQLAKEICKSEKVHYNTAEEGDCLSFNKSMDMNNIKLIKSKFKYSKDNYDQMFQRLSIKRQPKVIIVDSVQYVFRKKNVNDYFKLLEAFPNTLFIWISHISKGMPKFAVANEIYWDCQNRIIIEDFKAKNDKSRTGGDETSPYVISQQKADERESKLLKQG